MLMVKLKESTFKLLVYTTSLFVIVALMGIIYSLFREGLPFLGKVSLSELFLGKGWYPTHSTPTFGAFNLIIGSLIVTLGALIIAVPLGLGSALFISEIAGHKLREIIKPVIELLAGIPSVVYGLFGVAFLAPLTRQWFGLETGLNVFTTSIVLGIMVVPIIASVSEDALSGIPRSIREASLALGSTRGESIFRVIIPAAKSGIIGSVLLGFGRAIGETMVVLMISGGSATIPKSIFHSVRPLTSTIAAEMGETVMGDLHYRSLFALAIILFGITFFTNLVTETIFLKRRSR